MRMTTRRWTNIRGEWLCLGCLVSGAFRIASVVQAQHFNCSTGAASSPGVCVYRPLFKVRAIVHGQSSDHLWQQIQAAATQAGRDMNVDFDMQLYETFDDVVMANDILAAASTIPSPDALIVTIPDNVVQQAVGIVIQGQQSPIFGLNVGADVSTVPTKGFVALDDYWAGRAAGGTFRRLLAGNETNSTTTTAWKGLLVNHDCTYSWICL